MDSARDHGMKQQSQEIPKLHLLTSLGVATSVSVHIFLEREAQPHRKRAPQTLQICLNGPGLTHYCNACCIHCAPADGSSTAYTGVNTNALPCAGAMVWNTTVAVCLNRIHATVISTWKVAVLPLSQRTGTHDLAQQFCRRQDFLYSDRHGAIRQKDAVSG